MKTFNRVVVSALALFGTLLTPALANEQGNTIVPGQRIGSVCIGQALTTLAKLGKAATGDAAMMKEWLTWYSKPASNQPNANPAELDVYAVLHSDGATQKEIEVVRVTSADFKISNGIATGSSFAAIARAYPGIKLIKTYSTTKSRGPIQIYDDIKRGIAFEIYRGQNGKAMAGRCSAIIVHPRGQSMNDLYLSLPAYLRTLAEAPKMKGE